MYNKNNLWKNINKKVTDKTDCRGLLLEVLRQNIICNIEKLLVVKKLRNMSIDT